MSAQALIPHTRSELSRMTQIVDGFALTLRFFGPQLKGGELHPTLLVGSAPKKGNRQTVARVGVNSFYVAKRIRNLGGMAGGGPGGRRHPIYCGR